MATAADARSWAPGALRGIGDSLYTPFCGTDGDDIDWDAYRDAGALLRRRPRASDVVVHQRGRRVLVADHRRAKTLAGGGDRGSAGDQPGRRDAGVHRGDVGEGLPGTDAARPAGGRRHRLHPDADDGGARRRGRAALLQIHRRAHRYRSGHVQFAVLGVRADAAESARIYDEIPAVCATKEGAFRPANSRMLHELAPGLVVWECDKTVYRAGWLRDGIVCPAQLGTAGYLFETPQRRMFSEYWDLVRSDRLIEAMDYGRESGLDQFELDIGSWFTCYPGRAGLLHPLGWRVQVRRVAAWPADRCVPAFPAPAGRAARRGEGPDRKRVSAPGPAGNCVAVAAITQRSGPGR